MQRFRFLWIMISEGAHYFLSINVNLMKNVKILFVLLFAVSILSSCRKDSITTDRDINPPIPDVNIETTFNGLVIGFNGEPIIDVTVTVSSQMTQTNEQLLIQAI